MVESTSWLRRVIAVAAVMILVTTGAGVNSTAAADPGPAVATGVAVGSEPDGGFGVDHVISVPFQGFGCIFQGRSAASLQGQRHRIAVTAIQSGSNCPRVRVRAFVCGSGGCGTSGWVTRADNAEYIAPSGHWIRESYHMCEGCTLVHPIRHTQ